MRAETQSGGKRFVYVNVEKTTGKRRKEDFEKKKVSLVVNSFRGRQPQEERRNPKKN